MKREQAPQGHDRPLRPVLLDKRKESIHHDHPYDGPAEQIHSLPRLHPIRGERQGRRSPQQNSQEMGELPSQHGKIWDLFRGSKLVGAEFAESPGRLGVGQPLVRGAKRLQCLFGRQAMNLHGIPLLCRAQAAAGRNSIRSQGLLLTTCSTVLARSRRANPVGPFVPRKMRSCRLAAASAVITGPMRRSHATLVSGAEAATPERCDEFA